MQITNGSIKKTNQNGDQEEQMLLTYSEEERQENEINRNNAKLIWEPEFIPYSPALAKRYQLDLASALVYGFIKFFLGNCKTKRFYFSNEQLAVLLLTSESTIKRAINTLNKKDLIIPAYRMRAGGGKIRFIKLRQVKLTSSTGQIDPLKGSNRPYIENKNIENKVLSKISNVLNPTGFRQLDILLGKNAKSDSVNLSDQSDPSDQQKAKVIPVTPSDKNLLKPAPKVDGRKINELMCLFSQINPSLNFGNKTERAALEWLIEKEGERAEAIIKLAIFVQGKAYSPTITTPWQLKQNISKLAIYLNREKEIAKENKKKEKKNYFIEIPGRV